ncbi:serine/threonine protein phosphatase-like protein [Planoprotostelium fungivorum]|uniref:Serine/threonine-protein phosphatase n=1 Tax=Planoprotostelium fungivorum TaxID=1890364 RepID=A0A2P6N1I8_9EUKA|nr:serine/threonine protein phosphatase-like protein [Planoprotostelium fungivorum]
MADLAEEERKMLLRKRGTRALADIWKQAWNELDLQDENETVMQEAHLQTLLDELEARRPLTSPAPQSDESHPKFVNYDGPLWGKTEKMTVSFIIDMINYFKIGGVLHYACAHRIIDQATRLFDACENVVYHQPPAKTRFTVVGDLHGQLIDLLTIFHQNGMPSETNGYLFNGDFVDRGRRGLEVILVLYSFKILYPDHVFLNRGNHEQRHINLKYGFEEQVRTKYDLAMFELIQLSFRSIPLVTIIDNKIFVLHGGLFSTPNMTIAELQKSVRRIDIPGGARQESERTLEEVLWSDPKPTEGWMRSNRGAGIIFGPDVTRSFLQNNNLEIMIRSHEMKEEGWERTHDRRLITVFSASNYCRANENKGAYVVITAKENNPSVETKGNFEFPPVNGAERKEKAVSFSHEFSFYSYTADNRSDYSVSSKRSGTFERCQHQTMKKLKERIYQNRHDLLACFTRMDLDKDGRISSEDWANTLDSVLQLNLPWRELEPYLLHGESPIHYMKFVERFKIETSGLSRAWEEGLIHKICAKMYENSGDLQVEFQRFDTNSDGRLTYDEFVEALQSQKLGLTNDQLYDLMRSIDKDQSGSIDIYEFLERFQIAFNKIKAEKEGWIKGAAAEIGNLLYRQKRTVQQAFHEFDTDHNGTLSYREISMALAKIGLNYTDEEKMKIAAWIDEDGNGEISFKEFRNAFRIIDAKGGEWQDHMVQKVYTVLFKNKLQLHGVFRRMDSEGTGKLSLSDFKVAMEVVNQQLGSPVSPLQLRELYRYMVDEKSGYIDYEKFLGSFRVVDSRESRSVTDVNVHGGDTSTSVGHIESSSVEPDERREIDPEDGSTAGKIIIGQGQSSHLFCCRNLGEDVTTTHKFISEPKREADTISTWTTASINLSRYPDFLKERTSIKNERYSGLDSPLGKREFSQKQLREASDNRRRGQVDKMRGITTEKTESNGQRSNNRNNNNNNRRGGKGGLRQNGNQGRSQNKPKGFQFNEPKSNNRFKPEDIKITVPNPASQNNKKQQNNQKQQNNRKGSTASRLRQPLPGRAISRQLSQNTYLRRQVSGGQTTPLLQRFLSHRSPSAVRKTTIRVQRQVDPVSRGRNITPSEGAERALRQALLSAATQTQRKVQVGQRRNQQEPQERILKRGRGLRSNLVGSRGLTQRRVSLAGGRRLSGGRRGAGRL